MKPSQRSLIISTITVVSLSAMGAFFLSPVFFDVLSPQQATTQAITSSQTIDAKAILAYKLPLNPQKAKQDQTRNLAFYKKRVQQNPRSFLDQNLLANAYLTQAKMNHDNSWYLLAQKAAEHSLALQAVNPGAWQVLFNIAQAKHDFKTAEKLHIQIVKNTSGNKSNIFSNQITQHMAQNNLLEAKETARLWISQEPLMAAFIQLALIEEAQGLYDDALSSLFKGLSREQAGDIYRSSQARAWAGRILTKQGHFELAEQFYAEALRIDPENILAHELQGDLAFREKRYKTALQAYQKAFEIEKAPVLRFKQAQVDLALAQTTQAQAHLTEAEQMLRRELSEGYFGHRRELALLLLEKKETKSDQEAQDLMKQEYEIRKDTKTVQVYARSLNANQQFKQAQNILQHALNQGAIDGLLMQEAAYAEEKLGNTQKAQAYQKAAMRYDKSLS